MGKLPGLLTKRIPDGRAHGESDIYCFYLPVCVPVEQLNHGTKLKPNELQYTDIWKHQIAQKLVNLTRDSHSESWKNLSLMVLIMSGDIQVNPGLEPSIYLCGFAKAQLLGNIIELHHVINVTNVTTQPV